MHALKKLLLLFLFLISLGNIKSQSLYFPPTSGNTWDTISPASLGWCQPRIDSLYNYLQARHTKGFIILKDGKIVLEKYFGTFTKDSIWYWASAGKSLTATLVGIAQQENLLHINDPVSNYLGTGWTSAPQAKEHLITLKNLLSMTSGLDDNPTGCDNLDTGVACLQYLADAGTRWAYHSGAYRKLQDVVAQSSGMSYNLFTNVKIGNPIGMSGIWYDQVFYSKLRAMARFGLLILNKGVWNSDTLLQDSSYYYDMTHTSQLLNLSYGYLWWLNGQNSFMIPGSQIVFNQSLFPDAPVDLFAALGKNDQKIYAVPSQNLVVVRMGNAAYSSALALTNFDNELWQYIDSLDCQSNDIREFTQHNTRVYPNPVSDILNLKIESESVVAIYDLKGKKVWGKSEGPGSIEINCENWPKGIYLLKIATAKGSFSQKIVKD